MKRRKVDRSVTRKVLLLCGGRIVKTLRSRISVAQAIRELGGEPIGREGQLMTGMPLRIGRTITKGVRVELVYYADHRPRGAVYTRRLTSINARDAVCVARSGGAL